MSTFPFSLDEIPVEVRAKDDHVWRSIKDLVQVKPEDESQIVTRIAMCFVAYTHLEDMMNAGGLDHMKAILEKMVLESLTKSLHDEAAVDRTKHVLEKLAANADDVLADDLRHAVGLLEEIRTLNSSGTYQAAQAAHQRFITHYKERLFEKFSGGQLSG